MLISTILYYIRINYRYGNCTSYTTLIHHLSHKTRFLVLSWTRINFSLASILILWYFNQKDIKRRLWSLFTCYNFSRNGSYNISTCRCCLL